MEQTYLALKELAFVVNKAFHVRTECARSNSELVRVYDNIIQSFGSFAE